VGLEYGCPEYLRDYAAYEDEINLIGNAFTEVLAEGDAKGKAITQPSPWYSLRKDYSVEGYGDFMAEAHDLSFNHRTPVFTSKGNLLNSRGILQVITLNLPRAAYSARGEDDRLFEILDDLLTMSREALMIKREFIEDRINKGLLPFLGVKKDGEVYYSMDKVDHSVGYVGLNEMVKAHTGEEIHENRKAFNFGLRVLRTMAKATKEWRRETGLKWSLTTCPKESTSYRLAKLDYGEFSGKAVVNLSEEGRPFYTTTNVRKAPGLSLKEMLTMEGSFQAFTAGNIPVEISGDFADGQEIAELSRRIVASTGIKTWRFK
jgi:ribonucleoside-triphosphate reductase